MAAEPRTGRPRWYPLPGGCAVAASPATAGSSPQPPLRGPRQLSALAPPRGSVLPDSPLSPSPSKTGEGEETGAAAQYRFLCPAAVAACRPPCPDAAAVPGALLEAHGSAHSARQQRRCLNPLPPACSQGKGGEDGEVGDTDPPGDARGSAPPRAPARLCWGQPGVFVWKRGQELTPGEA